MKNAILLFSFLFFTKHVHLLPILKSNVFNFKINEELHGAVRSENVEKVKNILKNGTDPNSLNIDGRYTPLDTLFHKNFFRKPYDCLQIFKALVEAGAETTEKSDPMHIAASQGHLRIIEYLYSIGKNLEAVDEKGRTPLHIAVKNDKKNVVDYLIEKGVKIDPLDDANITPLHLAAAYNRYMVNLLLGNGSKINAVDKYGRTPLHYALMMNQKSAEILIKGSIDVADKEGKTPLHMAASHVTDLRIVDYLLGNGSNLEAVDAVGRTPLHYAAKDHESFSMVRYLLKCGSKVDAVDIGGKTALHYAAVKGQRRVICLIEGGSKDAQDGQGRTPLHLAAASNSFILIKYLVEKGSKIDAVDDEGRTPLHHAVIHNNHEAVKYLADYPMKKDKKGKTPLHYAAQFADLSVLKHLLDKGAKIDDVDNNGATPYEYSLFSSRPKNIEYTHLLSVDRIKENIDKLHDAVKSGDIEKIKKYLRKGAKVDDKGNDGKTSLHVAVTAGRLDIIKYLVVSGRASLLSKDGEDKTPFEVALQELNEDIMKYLASIKAPSCQTIMQHPNYPRMQKPVNLNCHL